MLLITNTKLKKKTGYNQCEKLLAYILLVLKAGKYIHVVETIKQISISRKKDNIFAQHSLSEDTTGTRCCAWTSSSINFQMFD